MWVTEREAAASRRLCFARTVAPAPDSQSGGAGGAKRAGAAEVDRRVVAWKPSCSHLALGSGSSPPTGRAPRSPQPPAAGAPPRCTARRAPRSWSSASSARHRSGRVGEDGREVIAWCWRRRARRRGARLVDGLDARWAWRRDHDRRRHATCGENCAEAVRRQARQGAWAAVGARPGSRPGSPPQRKRFNGELLRSLAGSRPCCTSF